ncbi:MAG: C39 family peptidase [Bacteroidota bacterium]
MKLCLSLFALVILITQLGCDEKNTTTVPDLKESELPDHVYINVVQIPQNDNYSCATTSVAMAISHFEGLDSTPLDQDSIWVLSGADSTMIRTQGNDMNALERITKHYGYQSKYTENLTDYDLELFLSKGILVVINFRPNVSGNNTHAVLVIGYDRSLKTFYVNDPAKKTPGTLFSYSDLEQRWTAWLSSPRVLSNHSGFIIYPKG